MKNLVSQLRNWERYDLLTKWQAAQTMRLLFGEGHLQRQPPLPEEYSAYAKVWLEEETVRINKTK